MSASPDRHWPPRLRHALRARLASLGQTLPRDLTIRHVTRDTPPLRTACSIEIRHAPRAGERMSVHDVHAPFRGEEDIEAVIAMGVRHAMAMNRRDARARALEAGGHDVHRPPVHMVEASPLIALAWTLVATGRAGIDGTVYIDNGQLLLRGTAIMSPEGGMAIDGARTLIIPSDKAWPDTVLAAMTGRPLRDVVALPACGRPDIDEAVATLEITEASQDDREIVMRVGSTPVLVLTEDDHGDDRTWLAMEPIPVC